jgi:RHS repeat-associated protein
LVKLICTYQTIKSSKLNRFADASGFALRYPAVSGANTYLRSRIKHDEHRDNAKGILISDDAKGILISDDAKGITTIKYNHLNPLTKFTQGANSIEKQYIANPVSNKMSIRNAAGRKLKKILSSGNTKSYIGNVEYVGSTVEAIYHAEGRARNNAGTYVYEYVIKDHLGDTRVAFTNTSGTIALIQENHYYPFGMQQGGWTAEPSPTNAYKYNGKELNTDFGLNLSDYGARWYEGSIGRFLEIDPLSEKMRRFSPYNYAFCNPMRFTDPDRKAPETIFKDENGKFLHETKDGINSTVTVSNMNVTAFNKDVAVTSSVGDKRSEEQKTVSLFNSYAADGQALSTVSREDGSKKIIDIGNAPLSTIDQIGITAGASGPAGPTVSGGFVFDSKGNVGLYGTIGYSHGINVSIGAEYTQSTSRAFGFNISSLEGISIMNNVSYDFIGIGHGGDTNGNGNYGEKAGATYKSTSSSVSLGIPVSYTKSVESTKVLTFKK